MKKCSGCGRNSVSTADAGQWGAVAVTISVMGIVLDTIARLVQGPREGRRAALDGDTAGELLRNVVMKPQEIRHIDPRWDDVSRKRAEAEDYARKDDILAAALLDHEASALAANLRREEASTL